MDAKRAARERERSQLLARLAELAVEEQREAGSLEGPPHYGDVERVAHQLGQHVSRQVQQRLSREVAADCEAITNCPTCGTSCTVDTQVREVASLDGPVELSEAVAACRRCRRSFFPSAGGDGAG